MVRHRNIRNLIAHYTNPLHLMGGIILMAYSSRNPRRRRILLRLVRGYDLLYRQFTRYPCK